MTIEIRNDAAGVPYATLNAECLPFHISLSHSRDHALCAATMYAIGANIECVEPRTSSSSTIISRQTKSRA